MLRIVYINEHVGSSLQIRMCIIFWFRFFDWILRLLHIESYWIWLCINRHVQSPLQIHICSRLWFEFLLIYILWLDSAPPTHRMLRIEVCFADAYVWSFLIYILWFDSAPAARRMLRSVCLHRHIPSLLQIYICSLVWFQCFDLILRLLHIEWHVMERWGAGVDPKKCTGRDWGMGSSTI